MRILITNDDGIQSPGLEALVKVLSPNHEVIVAAPASQQSAKSHAITVRERVYVDQYLPLQEKYGVKALAIGGTPADTVKLYLEGILQEDPALMPDLVISGINDGSNLGTDVIYSGTIGAASEGYIHHIAAIAISLDYEAEISFEYVAQELAKHLPKLLAQYEHKLLLNINFPKKLNEEPQWIWCTQGIREYHNAYLEHHDEDGRLYYLVGGTPRDNGNNEFSDIVANLQGHITVTPLSLDRTKVKFLASRKGKILE